MKHVIENASVLCSKILHVLYERGSSEVLFPGGVSRSPATSAVLLLLGQCAVGRKREEVSCLIFNKRSIKVKQPGDLCFPGGRISPGLDRHLSRLLALPFFPLGRWPYWPGWRRHRPLDARRLALLLAASLREGLEEMRLNPLGVTFLGPLPHQNLRMFDRVIYPMAVWVGRQKRYFPNWEVEKVVYIPLQNLLNPNSYGCYRLRMATRPNHPEGDVWQDFPCFIHQNEEGSEILWGATYRMTMLFLNLAFGFTPPALTELSIIEGALDHTYLTGANRLHRK